MSTNGPQPTEPFFPALAPTHPQAPPVDPVHLKKRRSPHSLAFTATPEASEPAHSPRSLARESGKVGQSG
ncbi:hypothetical protein BKA81DRAFT_366319 [Phyllosticta paracitricarpa]